MRSLSLSLALLTACSADPVRDLGSFRGTRRPPTRDHHYRTSGTSLLRPGPPPHVRIQSRRSDPFVRICPPARSGLRHVLVGDRVRRGSQHQRDDGFGGWCTRLECDPARSGARSRRIGSGTGIHRCTRGALWTRPPGRSRREGLGLRVSHVRAGGTFPPAMTTPKFSMPMHS